jgi:hypothetical protein
MDSGHNCDETRRYSREYDSYYCESCNCWLEDICNDRECLFCRTRPVAPSGDNNGNTQKEN